MEFRLAFVTLLMISGSCYGNKRSDESGEQVPVHFDKVEGPGDSDNLVGITFAGPRLSLKYDAKIHINKDFLTWLESRLENLCCLTWMSNINIP